MSAGRQAGTERFAYEISDTIRELALALPEATEGTSCVNRAFSAGGKNFAFLGEKDDGAGLRLKLADGWTMLRFTDAEHPLLSEFEAWLVESYRLLVPKRVSAQLDSSWVR